MPVTHLLPPNTLIVTYKSNKFYHSADMPQCYGQTFEWRTRGRVSRKEHGRVLSKVTEIFLKRESMHGKSHSFVGKCNPKDLERQPWSELVRSEASKR